MIAEKGKAAVLPAAGKSKLLIEPYQKRKRLSSLKLIVGGLLLFGNKKQNAFWPFFDAMLRQYLDLKLASENTSDKPGATNGVQRVVG